MAYKYKPTVEELRIIQEGIDVNDSYRMIAEKVGCSEKTVKVIVEDYNLDISSYNPRKAHGRRRIKNLNSDEVEEVKRLLKDGVSLKKIGEMYAISHPTLIRILKENGIEHGHYKRRSEKKFTLTDMQKEKVKQSLESGAKIKDLAEKYQVSRNTLSSYLKEVSIISNGCEVSDKQKQFIINAHNAHMYLNTIVDITKIQKSAVKDIVDQSTSDIAEKDKYLKNRRNRQDYFNEVINWYDKYNEIRSGVSADDIKYVLNNIDKEPFLDIVKTLNVEYESLRRAMIILDKKDIFTFESIMSYEYKEEFLSDLSTNAHTSVMVAKKYGSKATSVSSWRKGLYGEFKTYYTTSLSKSELEMEFELLLHSLQIAFIPEYMIKGLKFDYYIGHKILCELQGAYWHEGTAVKDEDKKTLAEASGYTVIQIPEKDFYENKASYMNRVLNTYLEAIQKQYLA